MQYAYITQKRKKQKSSPPKIQPSPIDERSPPANKEETKMKEIHPPSPKVETKRQNK